VAVTVTFVAWISFYYDIYIICEDTIVDITQQGFFGRQIAELSLLRVQDVTSNIEGFLPTLFGYGDVLVETAGEKSQNFLLKSLPNPQEVAAKIMQLHNDLIEKEGRHHEILEAEGALRAGNIGEPVASVKKEPPPEIQPRENSKQGEISHNDLDKGGEIELK
jgi:uncharacterized membrane protein YdbT with pleckstrin-like domain